MIDSCIAEPARLNKRWLLAALTAAIAFAVMIVAPSVAAGGGSQPPAPEVPKVEKTAYAKWVQKIDWQIEKKLRIKDGEYADRQNWQIFWGDSVWANYLVAITKQVENKYSVHGKITIPLFQGRDGGQGAIKIKDVITLKSGEKIEVPYENLRCEGYEGVPETVVYQGELVCYYWVYLEKPEHGVNAVYVWLGDYKTPMKAEAEFWFDKEPNRVHGHKQVWVKDRNFPDRPLQGPYYGSQRLEYKKHFECNQDENPLWHTNTAKLLAAGQASEADRTLSGGADYKVIAEDSARLHLECFGIDVEKDANTKFKRLYRWKIEKVANRDKIELVNTKNSSNKGSREVTVKYGVTVDTYADDLGFRAWGKITITNEHPKRAAEIVDVKDTILQKGADPIYANVSCESDKKDAELGLPATIPPGETLTCYWESKLPDGSDRKNVAEVELQNFHREIGAKTKRTDTTWFRGYAPVKFGNKPWKLIDEKVGVYDTLAPKNFLGWVGRKDAPKTFRYEVLVTPGDLAPTCGKGTLDNTASLKPVDTRIKYEVSLSIPIHVTCDDPKKDPPPKVDPPKQDPPKVDPPPADDKKADPDPKKDDPIVCVPGKGKPWHLIGPEGKKSQFFESGMTYKQVMKKGLRSKNPHHRMARAYIIAKLYMLAGSDSSKKAERAMRWAERYLASHGSTDSKVKRAPNVNKAKKLRKAINNKKRVLIKYGKHATMPRCDVS